MSYKTVFDEFLKERQDELPNEAVFFLQMLASLVRFHQTEDEAYLMQATISASLTESEPNGDFIANQFVKEISRRGLSKVVMGFFDQYSFSDRQRSHVLGRLLIASGMGM